MKKRILSALLLACALVVAPVGNLFSTVATASGNSGETQRAYRFINEFFNNLSGRGTSLGIGWEDGTAVVYPETMSLPEVLRAISDAMGVETIQRLIEIDPQIAGQFRQFEMMMGEAGVTTDAVSEVGEIPVVKASGAALNAEGENVNVRLSVKYPGEGESAAIDGKNLQVDISLFGVADSHNLLCPVQITLSAPAGFNVEDMHIRHYADGVSEDYEVVNYTVNGDGTITFSVSSFSIFAFVEGPAPDNAGDGGDDTGNTDDNNGNNTDNNGNETDNNDNEDDDSADEPAAAQGVKDSVPKTGDTTVPVMPFAMAGAACSAAAFALRKKENK